jgi:hypothetical protein
LGLILIALVASFGSLLWGQAETGQIVGTIRDATGGFVPKAKVTVKSATTGYGRRKTPTPTVALRLRTCVLTITTCPSRPPVS